MKRMSMMVAAAGASALLAPAAGARPRDVPPVTAIGAPVSCIQPNRIRETRVRDDSTIDFYMIGGPVKLYRNVLPHSCPNLGFQRRFLYETQINQLCSVDIITVINDPPVSRGASCGLGMFQPAALPERRVR